MRYDKQNRKLDALNAETVRLREQNSSVYAEAQNIKEILNSTLHEVRRFSAQLTKFSERLSRETEGQPQINNTVQSVFYTAGMISSRLAYTDIELNPRAIESQTVVRSGIYKKFDKANRLLAEEARQKGVSVRLVGESRIEIDALPVFELLPFVLLDNAIKYSPRDQSITVCFETTNGRQVVNIQNVGPSVSATELPHLFEKGFRGTQAASLPGEGLGLFLAKRVCDFHDIEIHAEIGRRDLYQIGRVFYSEFRVVLQF